MTKSSNQEPNEADVLPELALYPLAPVTRYLFSDLRRPRISSLQYFHCLLLKGCDLKHISSGFLLPVLAMTRPSVPIKAAD